MVFVIPAVALLLALGVGWALVRNGLTGGAWGLAVVLAGLGGWLVYMGRGVQGWDAMGYAIGLMLMVLPALVGLGLGALIGWWRRSKAAAEAA